MVIAGQEIFCLFWNYKIRADLKFVLQDPILDHILTMSF